LTFASDLACGIVLMMSGGVHSLSTFAANCSLKTDIFIRLEIERSRVSASAVQPSLLRAAAERKAGRDEEMSQVRSNKQMGP